LWDLTLAIVLALVSSAVWYFYEQTFQEQGGHSDNFAWFVAVPILVVASVLAGAVRRGRAWLWSLALTAPYAAWVQYAVTHYDDPLFISSAVLVPLFGFLFVGTSKLGEAFSNSRSAQPHP
jgi:hypothetical protein